MSDNKTPRIVNCRTTDFDIYIGRGSPYGNPFTHIKYGTQALYIVDTVEEAIAEYGKWLFAQPELVAMVKRELRGKVLGCYCNIPQLCHGSIILRIANEKESEE
jgi:hypothetical protein